MALLNTDFLTARTQTFRATRRMLGNVFQEGVYAAGDYKVTPTGTSLQWSSAAGDAWVQGDTALQGLYHQVNDAAVTGLVAAGHATLPRLDQVILQIADSSVSGVSDTPTLSTLQGTATSGATLDNRNGFATLPNAALLLADILVPAAHSGVLTTGMIRDRRPWARGAYSRIERTGGTYTITSATLAEIDVTNLKPRIECSGLPVRLTFTFMATSTGGGTPRVWFAQDGATLNGLATTGALTVLNLPGATGDHLYSIQRVVVPTAGSHTFAPMGAMTAAATNFIIRAIAAQPAEFTVEEIVRQNASND